MTYVAASRRWVSCLVVCGVLHGLPAGRTAAQEAVPAPAKGDVIPAFDAQAVDGSSQHVDFAKGPVVLLFFLSGCPTCHKMIPEWNHAYERRPNGLRVVGVLMDQEPPGFFQTMNIAFPVLRSPGRDFLRSLKVTRAPATLRVGRGGTVEEAVVGMVDPIKLGEMFRR
jgi:peroxiredoxin